MEEMTIIRPDDFHVHLRQGSDLATIVRETAKVFGRALAMPNLKPPVLNYMDARAYWYEIIGEAAKDHDHELLKPLMTIQIVAGTTPQTIRELQRTDAPVLAGKLYPAGVTTNSQNGVWDIEALYPVFAEMESQGVVLCLHGEKPGVHCLDREESFLSTLVKLAGDFPKLRIVLEHLSTAMAVWTVELLPQTVAATITAHHLVLTLDDVVGDLLQPHHFCKPIPKRSEDRSALIAAATSGNPKFFFGSDSAPHVRGAKECASGCAGVFSAPVALPVLAEVFERAAKLNRLEAFVSKHGAAFYGLPQNKGTITLRKEPWVVPKLIDSSFVPFRAGQTLSWKIS